MKCFWLIFTYAPIAQLIEHWAHMPKVPGSNPGVGHMFYFKKGFRGCDMGGIRAGLG